MGKTPLEKLRVETEKEKYRRLHPTEAQLRHRIRFTREAREVTGIRGVVEYKGRMIPASAAKIAELERKAEESRKEEERLKKQEQQINEEYRKSVKSVIDILRKAAFEEEMDSKKYQEWSSRFAGIPTVQDILMKIAREESQHQKYLLDLIYALERKIQVS